MELRPDLWVVVEGAEPNRDLVSVGPGAPKQARAADAAKDLDGGSALRLVDTEKLLSGEEPKLLPRHSTLRQAEGAGMLATERAVTVARTAKRKGYLEPDTPTKAASADRTRHDTKLHFAG